jgi:hypothetical protein
MRRWLFSMCVVSAVVACGLNPQPLPPEDTASTDASVADSGSPSPKGDGGSNADASISDANIVDASDGGDASDGSHDADTDGG